MFQLVMFTFARIDIQSLIVTPMDKLLRSALLICIIALSISSCKQSTEPVQSSGSDLQIPFFRILPAGTIVDGGCFMTLSGKFQGSANTTINRLTSEVALSYHDWPTITRVTLDGSAVTDYIMGFDASPAYGSHLWKVDSNATDGIPQISQVVAPVTPVEISIPLHNDSVSHTGFTVKWTPGIDTTSSVVIIMTGDPKLMDSALYNSDTSGSYIIKVKDNGSYTFPSSALTGIPLQEMVQVAIIRFNYTLSTISSKKYLFLNGCQTTATYKLK